MSIIDSGIATLAGPKKFRQAVDFAQQCALERRPFADAERASGTIEDDENPDDFTIRWSSGPAGIRAAQVLDAAMASAYRQGQIEIARVAVTDVLSEHLERLSDPHCQDSYIELAFIEAAKATEAKDGRESAIATADDFVAVAGEYLKAAGLEIDDPDLALIRAHEALRDFHTGWSDPTPEDQQEVRESLAEVEARFAADAIFADMSDDADLAEALCDAYPDLPWDAAEKIASRALKRHTQTPSRKLIGDTSFYLVEPDDTDWELHRKAADIMLKATVPNVKRLALAVGTTSSRAIVAALMSYECGDKAKANDEPRPLDLWQHYEAPELPAGLLPPLIEEFARRQGYLMGASPAGVAMSALAVCSAAIHDEIMIQPKKHDPAWRESCRLWVGLVGAPSAKKSPVLRATAKPLQDLDSTLVSRYLADKAVYDRLEKKEQANAVRPLQIRHVVGDTTVEALQEVLRDTIGGVLSFQDELSGWFASFDKHNPTKGAQADRGFYLQAFGGGVYNLNRVGRGVVQIPNLSVSIVGGIQPEAIRAVASTSVDDGLLQRFLPVILSPACAGHDEPVGTIMGKYTSLVQRLAAMKPLRGDGSPSGAIPVRFSDAALEIRERLEREHSELTAALDLVSPKLASHIGKLDGIFARLCLLWHCVESDGRQPAPVIEVELAGRVAAFMEQFIRPSGVAFYAGVLGFTAGHEELLRLAGYIVSEGLQEITARDVQRAMGSRCSYTADEARRVLEKLENFGWLAPIDPRQKSHSPRWRVVPAVHDLFAERGKIESERRAAGRAALKRALGV